MNIPNINEVKGSNTVLSEIRQQFQQIEQNKLILSHRRTKYLAT